MNARLNRNLFVEFAGMPKSGKSTILNTVSHYLRRSTNLRISEYHGGGRYAPMGKEDLGALNLYLACQVVQHLLECNSAGRSAGLHLLDRGSVDRQIFTLALANLGRVSASHRSSVEALLTCDDIPPPDLCFVFVTSPQLSLERENRDKLTATAGSVMNNELLLALEQAARQVTEERSTNNRAAKTTFLIDTTTMDGLVPETARRTLDHLQGSLIDAGVTFPPEVAQ